MSYSDPDAALMPTSMSERSGLSGESRTVPGGTAVQCVLNGACVPGKNGLAPAMPQPTVCALLIIFCPGGKRMRLGDLWTSCLEGPAPNYRVLGSGRKSHQHGTLLRSMG